jgi:hypothetical protein
MQYASVVSERDQLKHELAQTQQEHDLRGVIDEMLATRRACEMAEAELVRLYRERAIARARAAERAPDQLLQ